MSIQYLIWAVLHKGDLALYERQAVAEYLAKLEGGNHG